MSVPVALRPQPHPALIQSYLKGLKLPAIAAAYQAVARDAEQQQVGYLSYLEALLEREYTQRQERRLQQRLVQARFPYHKRLEDFDFAAVPALQKTAVFTLAQGSFLKDHHNLLIVGPSGLGKTHLLIGVGRALCLRGYRVLFRTAAALVTELELAQRDLRLPKLLAQFRRFDLVLVDELGYLPFSPTAAELLFQFFADRYERASVGLTIMWNLLYLSSGAPLQALCRATQAAPTNTFVSRAQRRCTKGRARSSTPPRAGWERRVRVRALET